jgi:peptide/nickel transport system substrate-binding protein
MHRLLLATASALAIASAASAATPPNMLVIGTDVGAIPTLDPAALNARTVSEVVSNLYDNLVQLPWDDMTTLQPMLAESWDVSEDGRKITLKMRQGATFASGNPVTAEDAAWSLQRVIKLGLVGATDIKLWGFTPDNVDKAIRAEGDTVVIEPPEEVSPELVLYSLAGSSVGIIDRKVALEHEQGGDLARDWLKANVAASGAFTVSQWRPNDLLMAEARDNYYGGKPAMQRVVLRHIPESGSLRLQLEAGDVDVGHYVGASDLDALAKSDEVRIENTPGFGFYYIALNQKDEILSNPKVREAFQHLLDWQALAKTTMTYLGFPHQSIIPKGMPGSTEETFYNYDLDKARQLLAEAGYPNGFKKKVFPAGPEHLQNVESLQASAKQVGIDLEIVPGRHVEAFRDRKFEVYMGNSGARLPDPFATATHYAYNPDNSDEAKLSGYYMWRTAWYVPEFTEMVDQSKREPDAKKRAQLFADLQSQYREKNPSLVVFFQRTDPYVIRSNVQGYHGHPTWSTRWHDVTKQ